MYDAVKPQIVRETNEIIDGVGEAAPEISGRVQWSQSEDAVQMLYFRATKALTWTDGAQP